MKSNNISSNKNSNNKFNSFEVIKLECDKNVVKNKIDKEILKKNIRKK
jgi:hypothetical protein